jgi:hypothetical protein
MRKMKKRSRRIGKEYEKKGRGKGVAAVADADAEENKRKEKNRGDPLTCATASITAPLSTSILTISVWPFCAARMSAVAPS